MALLVDEMSKRLVPIRLLGARKFAARHRSFGSFKLESRALIFQTFSPDQHLLFQGMTLLCHLCLMTDDAMPSCANTTRTPERDIGPKET